MAFDGITIAAMVRELHQNLDGGRFNKIAQPEPDALVITAKGANGQHRLLLSASASLPLIYFIEKNKPSPLTAPNFAGYLLFLQGYSQQDPAEIIRSPTDRTDSPGTQPQKIYSSAEAA